MVSVFFIGRIPVFGINLHSMQVELPGVVHMEGAGLEREDAERQSLRVVPFGRRPRPLHNEDGELESPKSIALERHFTVPEVAKRWGMSEKSVRRFFADEPGVLKWGSPETRKKRGYCNLRIPESVLIRVHQRRAS
jgi:hypothetical protein